ncbi:hypothetical protein B0H11DRAFT_1925119 [Mycena galericulata]|nr:hypothetical protein B0H11DRAFT_1925119 [Mycena galericulata]
MPPGAPYNSFVAPYRIRVDEFANSVGQEMVPALHLLSHTHSDHINGLQAKSFGYTVICSHDAKEMLLRHEVFLERSLHEHEYRAETTRTYSHLKVDPLIYPDGSMYYTGSRDLLRPLPLNTPTEIELSNDESVTITLFDANHCPGAVMFLIQGAQGALLHTGDFRAEPWFLDSITHNPFLQPYLALSDSQPDGPLSNTIEAIYLDTACVMSSAAVPTKAQATSGLVELMKLLPSNTYFFINSWTWGYEDVLKAISRAFRSRIHLDRYKHSIYTNISDPLLRTIGTRDEATTRFHACERFERCDYAAAAGPHQSRSQKGKPLVYVNPVTMDAARWNTYLQETKLRIARGEVVTNLLVPLSRHSPLPELQAFVSLFRPRRVVPNTLIPGLHGLDWMCIDRMFAGSLAVPPPPEDVTIDAELLAPDEALGEMEDVALLNLVGGAGARDLADKWAQRGTLRSKIAVVRDWLDIAERRAVDRVLEPVGPVGKVSVARREQERMVDSEDEDSNYGGEADDERGRTAHLLFASLAGIDERPSQWGLPSSSPASTGGAGGSGTRQGGFLTPVSSPLRFQRAPHSQPAGKDKGKKRQIDESPASASPPSAKRVRLALGSPFPSSSPTGTPTRRYHDNGWLSIYSPPPASPLRAVGNTVASSSKRPRGNNSPAGGASLPKTPQSDTDAGYGSLPQLPATALLPASHSRLRSPSGAVYTFYEILPASSPALAPQQPSSTTPPCSGKGTAPRAPRRPPRTLASIQAALANVAHRLKMHDRMRAAHPERPVVGSFAVKRKQLEARHFRLSERVAYLTVGDAPQEPPEVGLGSSFETVYDVGEDRLQNYGIDEGLKGRIEEALKTGKQPMVPLLVSAQSQSLDGGELSA